MEQTKKKKSHWNVSFQIWNFSNVKIKLYDFQCTWWMDPYWSGSWWFNCYSTRHLSSFYIRRKGNKIIKLKCLWKTINWKIFVFFFWCRIISKRSDTLSVSQCGYHTIGRLMKCQSDKIIWNNCKKDFNNQNYQELKKPFFNEIKVM